MGTTIKSINVNFSSSQLIKESETTAFLPISKELETGEKLIVLPARPRKNLYDTLALRVYQKTNEDTQYVT